MRIAWESCHFISATIDVSRPHEVVSNGLTFPIDKSKPPHSALGIRQRRGRGGRDTATGADRCSGGIDTDGMTFSRRLAGFVLAVAAFMVFEWIMLGFNLADGHPTAFYVVHGVLIGVNIVLALVLAAIGVRAWRSQSGR
jgi:hypothetical protein